MPNATGEGGRVAFIRRIAVVVRTVVVAAIAALPARRVRAQAPDTGAIHGRLGVALSGGSAKGLAHIGVLRVLEEEGIPVSVVAGTSMGSLVGGLYAAGLTPDSLQALVTRLDWAGLFNDATERRLLTPDRRLFGGRELITFPVVDGRPQLPTGLVTGRSVDRLLARLTWPYHGVRDFRRLRVPFSAVATDISSGEAVVLDHGTLAEAMRASMAFPGLFRPVKVDGKLLVDGGLARNLPAQDARALGAELLICSDVSGKLEPAENLRSAVDILMQTVSFQMMVSTEEQRRRCDVVIEPETEGLSSFSFDRAEEWIRRGEAAARAKLPELRALRARATAVRAASAAPAPESVYVRSVEIRGVPGGEADRVVQRALRFRAPGWATATSLDEAIQRVYATGLFERVTYRLDAPDSDAALVVEVAGEAPARLGFGFRYDDHSHAALLFSASAHNLLRYGSVTRIDLRLGEASQLRGQYLRGRGVSGAFSLGFGAGYTRAPMDVYDGDDRVAEVKSEAMEATGFAGVTIGRSTLAGMLLTLEHARGATSIAATDSSRSQTFGSISAVLFRETLDRPAFPSRGSRIYARSEWSDRGLSGVEFSHHVVDAQGILPLSPATVVNLRATLGTATGADDLPLDRLFFLGGAYPSPVFPESHFGFLGLRPEQRFGTSLQVIRAALQHEVRDGIFLTATVNAGNTADRFGDVWDNAFLGIGLSLGVATVAGPVEVTASGRRLNQRPRIEISLGNVF